MLFEALFRFFFALISSLYQNAPGCGAALSPPEPRALRASICGTHSGGNLETRLRLKHLNFFSPAFAFLEPEVRIGGDRAEPQQVACSGLGVSLCAGHHKLDPYLAETATPSPVTTQVERSNVR